MVAVPFLGGRWQEDLSGGANPVSCRGSVSNPIVWTWQIEG